MEQRVTGYCQHGTEEKQQVVQLIHGKHRAATCRADPVAGQQRHECQRPTATAWGGANGEFGGHHYAEAAYVSKLCSLLAKQQAQPHGIDHPAQQDHAQQGQHQAGVEGLEPGQQFASPQQGRYRHGHH
ncbi:hypothetical protein D3C81_793420 [compost metagenome]